MKKILKEILTEVFDAKATEITENSTNEDISSWDSLTQMDLVTSLENEFDVQLEILEIVSLTSVKKIIETLEDKGIKFDE
jgi:acyl carrier protein